MIFYPEQLILDHEICTIAHELMHGFDFDEFDICLDVIKGVGPRNNFLIEEQTVKHLRDFRLSPLLNKQDTDGSPQDAVDLAQKEFKRIDKSHHPVPLPKEMLVELDRIISAADREAERLS